MDHHDLTVYHFARDPREHEMLDEVLLDRAAKLVTYSTDIAVWHTPRESINPSVFLSIRKGMRYIHNPPPCPQGRQPSELSDSGQLREWETEPRLYDDEQWTLAELEEFDHAPLHTLLDRRPSSRRREGSTVPVPDVPIDDATQARKRLRLDHELLFDALPVPHFHPPLMMSQTPWPAFEQADFRPSTPTPIAPYTPQSANEYIEDPFARLAWVIPVRGRLPWPQATSASVAALPREHSSTPLREPLPEAPQTGDDSTPIIWTRDALGDFWGFLKDLRHAGNMGPLSLSFHVAPTPLEPSSMSQSPHYGVHPQDSTLGSRRSSTSEDSPSSGGYDAPTAAINQSDHIKVYHDARYTKVLRNILHVWSYKKPGIKVRLLKGATLALMDEHGKGLLLC
ncbi:hypothetical protein C8Q77DRAFT_1055171 [Trametes polyzona]|nr:hypothetical protein C8Q77DRAFT_1055171 [Trametes polyzona]